MCVGMLPASMSVHHMCAWFLWRPEEALVFVELELEKWAALWVLRLELRPWEEQPLLLSAVPSLPLLIFLSQYFIVRF